MKRILVAGGSGNIGKTLCKRLLQKGYEVCVLSREYPTPSNALNTEASGTNKILVAHWSPHKGIIDNHAIAWADAIINLAGAGIADKRWTKHRKQEIVRSRVACGSLLVKALQETDNKVQCVVNASAIGWYGSDHGQEPFIEDLPAADDFLGAVCKQWEDSVQALSRLGKRLVILRTGIVLGRHGGAFQEFLKPLKMRVAAVLGNGKQLISWIHEEDLCDMYIHAIEQPTLCGVYNAVAPKPVSNEYLMRRLAATLYRKGTITIKIPRFVLRIVLGSVSEELLKSCTVSAAKIKATGFRFQFENIDAAITDLTR
jgi:uncharacterized protein (TIGR01777 family)